MDYKKIRTRKGAAVIGLVIALFFFMLLAGIFAFDASRAQMAQRELIATCDSAALAGTAMLASEDISNDVSPPPPAAGSKLYIAQQKSAGYARNMFQAGNILGQPLTAANPVTVMSSLCPSGPVTTGAANVLIGLADPENNFNSVSPGDTHGKAIMVFAAYGYHPVFLGIIGVQNLWLRGQSTGGLPQVDSVMVFDYSGSMDDNTRVTFVRRYWDRRAIPPSGSADGLRDNVNPTISGAPPNTNGCIRYKPIVPWSTACELTEYIKFDFGNFPTGTHLNVLPPQNLQASVAGSQLGAGANIVFDTLLRCPIGRRDVGTPPGNCTIDSAICNHPDATCTVTTNGNSNWTSAPAVIGGNGNQYCGGPSYTFQMTYDDSHTGGSGYKTNNVYFTDLIVNIANPGSWPYTQPLNGVNNFDSGGNYTWNSCTVSFNSTEPDSNLQGRSFTFPSLPFVVECARGNLDQANRRQAALLSRGAFCDYAPACTSPASFTAADFNPAGGAAVDAHYQRAYQRLAMLYSQPIATATDGADGGFFQKVNSLCDARFGFVGFSDSFFGTPPTAFYETQGSPQGSASIGNSAFISSNFCGAPYNLSQTVWNGQLTCASGAALPYGVGATTANRALSSPEGGSGFRVPRVRLANGPGSPEDQATLFTRCVGLASGFGGSPFDTPSTSAPWSAVTSAADGVYNGRPMTNTDCYEAMNTAYLSFTTYDPENYRIAARRAIVFFTDGEPTGGLGGSEATNTTGLAANIKGAGIAVYTIGLNITGNITLTNDQSSFLGNNTGGLAKECGNGGRFFACNSADAVKKAFAAVARRLTQAQR